MNLDGLPWYVLLTIAYARMIESGLHFAQANYGDGEWGCILGHRLTNSQGEVYCDELEVALKDTLLQPSGVWCGSNPGPKLAEEADRWVRDNEVDVPWMPKEVLAAANVNGKLAPFLRALREQRVILVGPWHLANLSPDVIGEYTHILVPDATAWTVAEETSALVLRMLRPDDLVLFAAGMGTNLMIHRMWPVLPTRVTLLDVGAIFDPYVGVYSRKAYKREKFQNEAMRENLRC